MIYYTHVIKKLNRVILARQECAKCAFKPQTAFGRLRRKGRERRSTTPFLAQRDGLRPLLRAPALYARPSERDKRAAAEPAEHGSERSEAPKLRIASRFLASLPGSTLKKKGFDRNRVKNIMSLPYSPRTLDLGNVGFLRTK
jgi:hypothetical protein